MARSNQPPKPECCRIEGQAQVSAQEADSLITIVRRTHGDSQAASESRTSLKQFSPETILQRAGGDAVASRLSLFCSKRLMPFAWIHAWCAGHTKSRLSSELSCVSEYG